MISTLKRLMPSSIKQYTKYAIHSVSDLSAYLSGKQKPMVPPKRKIFIGGGDFESIGRAFLESLTEHTNIQPDSKVLDVGSGQGRMALPLTSYLAPEGEYCGIEIVESAIDWCNNEYSKYPNFHFIHANVFNEHYNKSGAVKANNYKFPFEDDTFDVVFLTSVFTHMFPDDVTNYLSEIYRCLKPNGRCLITFFLLNNESKNSIRDGTTNFSFRYSVNDHCLTMTKDDPEDAIAYEEQYITNTYKEIGLKIIGDIQYGSWTPREVSYGLQDMIVAEK